MSYINVYPARIDWENEPSINTPINALNLNKMDYALYSIDQTLASWDTTKANQSDLLLCVKSITYDTDTGVFVFTWHNGTTQTVDLNIEKIPVSFSMDANGVITMTTEDGTQYTADVGALIKTYTFTDSTVIDFTVTTDASGNKTVTADIVDGSITGTKLQPNYLADCQTAETNAGNSATAAAGSSSDSEAWAVGTRGGVPVPSTDPAFENNSYWWSQHGAASSLAGLTDTDITTPTDGQALIYDGANSKWINGTARTTATNVSYNNATSGLPATDVQDAIDEVYAPTFTEAGSRSNISSGDTLATLFGKIKKWFTDLKSGAFVDTINDLTGINATGATNTTGATITAGTYFYLDNVLVRAKANIANGATFTLNTNYEVVTVGALNELRDAYSSSEQRVGTWTDGKPVYKITLTGSYGTITDGVNSTIDCGLIDANLKQIISMKGMIISAAGDAPLPYLFPSTTPNRFVNMYVYTKHAWTRSNWGDFSNGDVYITVEYTKTTD